MFLTWVTEVIPGVTRDEPDDLAMTRREQLQSSPSQEDLKHEPTHHHPSMMQDLYLNLNLIGTRTDT